MSVEYFSIENYRQVFEQIITSFPDHVYIRDVITNRRIMENTSTARILGYQIDPSTSMHAFYDSILHPDAIEIHHRFCADTLTATEGKVYEMTVYVKAADETWHWLNYREKLLLRNYTGKPWLMLGTSRDVTELINIEEELRKTNKTLSASEAHYKAIIDSQTVFVNRYNHKGELTFVNQAVCDFFHKTQEEMLGRAIYEFLGHEDAIEVEKNLMLLTPDNPIYLVEHRVSAVDEKEYWQHWVNQAIFDEEGRFVEFQATGWDITEQHHALQVNQQLIDILEATPDIVSMANPELQMQYLNKAGYSFFNLPDDAIISNFNVCQFLPERVQRLYKDRILPEVKTQGSWLGETAVINGNGIEIPVSQIVLGHFDAQGNLSRISSTFRDIRYIKEFEHLLRDKELEVQEQQSHLIVDELHDRIGQNLTVLNLNLTLLGNRVEQGKQPITRQDIDTSLQLVEETMASIRNIMSEIRPPALDDYGLFIAIRNSAMQFAGRTGIKIFVEGKTIEPRLPRQYEIALFRIYQEALINVVKHARATKVVINLFEKQSRINLSIQDNGKGFNSSKIQRNEIREGRGIPSMISRAKDMGAVFTIESEPGKGTQIKVELERPQ